MYAIIMIIIADIRKNVHQVAGYKWCIYKLIKACVMLVRYSSSALNWGTSIKARIFLEGFHSSYKVRELHASYQKKMIVIFGYDCTLVIPMNALPLF